MFGGTSSPGDSISSNPERTALRRRGEDPSGYIEVLPQRAWSKVNREADPTENTISFLRT